MHVCIVGGSSALAKEVRDHWIGLGNRVSCLSCRGSIADLREITRSLLEDQIDALVTFTGAVDNGKLISLSASQWDHVLDATLTSVFKALHVLLPYVKNDGAVVVVGSIVGSTGGHGCANYAAAKAGLVGLVRAAANENPHLRINLLELGYVDAGMGARLSPEIKEKIVKTIPMKRFATVAEVVAAVDFLLKQTYMTGGVLTFAGGLR